MNGVGPPSSDCGSNSVQTNSLISLPNSQPTVLLSSMSDVFIEGGSTGDALFRVRMAVMGYSLHSPLFPSLLLIRAGLCYHIVIALYCPRQFSWDLPPCCLLRLFGRSKVERASVLLAVKKTSVEYIVITGNHRPDYLPLLAVNYFVNLLCWC
jgi:hypothetical protein